MENNETAMNDELSTPLNEKKTEDTQEKETSENQEKKSEVLYDAENPGDFLNSMETPFLPEGMTSLFDLEEDINQKKEAIKKEAEEYQKPKARDVFHNGLSNGEYVLGHRCPMCGFSEKKASELYTRKRFSREKKIVGYASVCANCGFTSFYTTDISNLLGLFRGKVKM